MGLTTPGQAHRARTLGTCAHGFFLCFSKQRRTGDLARAARSVVLGHSVLPERADRQVTQG